MPRQLDPVEHMEYTERLIYPNFAYRTDTMSEKLRVAGEVSGRAPQQVMLLGGIALSEPCVVAGLKPEYVEYIVRNGSLQQKSGLLGFAQNDAAARELHEIARRMDLDAGGASRIHQDNAEIILNYVHDIAPAIVREM